MKQVRNRHAFTLIELLVVIAILAVLVGAALPYVQSYVQESRISKAKSDLEAISRALATYEMREKTYTASDVFQLDGRYLSKSPLDPWGKAYIVATGSGVVFSCGPDRIPYNADDIVFPYQPSLALTQVTWVDANHSGQVDTQNTPDYLVLSFSRGISASSAVIQNPSGAHANFALTGTTTIDAAFHWGGLTLSADLKQLTLPLATGVVNAFVPGSDTLTVKAGNEIWDLSRVPNRCLASQDVVIQPQ